MSSDMTPKLVVPKEFNRNAPNIAVVGPEKTGATLINLVIEELGLKDLRDVDVLDVGCGVRFTQAIINCDIPIKSYSGIDLHEPLIRYLQQHVTDPRFTYRPWDVHHRMYNVTGQPKLTRESRLPFPGDFDLIWLFSVFTHMDPEHADSLLAILRRHVRPAGWLFFSAFIDPDLEGFEDRAPDTPLLHAYYGETLMRRLLGANRWEVLALHPKDPERYIQHYFVCRPG